MTHDLKLESLPSQKSSLNQSNQESPFSRSLTASPPGLDLPTRARSLAALTICSRIWASIADTSEAAGKACAAVRFVLARAIPQAPQPPQQQAQAPQQQHQQQDGMPMAFDSTVYSTNANLTDVTGSGLADMQLDGFDMVSFLPLSVTRFLPPDFCHQISVTRFLSFFPASKDRNTVSM